MTMKVYKNFNSLVKEKQKRTRLQIKEKHLRIMEIRSCHYYQVTPYEVLTNRLLTTYGVYQPLVNYSTVCQLQHIHLPISYIPLINTFLTTY